ncbi:MAG TPA: hypothetical protein VFW24_18770 [Acidimicrobiales bacterium]|nr:hypothetical protein [Acidimicrobiales bacterium]
MSAAPAVPAVPLPAPPARPARPALRALPRTAPRGRLGVLWLVVTGVAMAGGPWALAAWLALGSAVAVLAVTRSWPGRTRPAPAGALVAALGAPLAAAAGTPAFAAVVCAALALAVLPRRARIGAALRAALRRRAAEPRERAAVVGIELVAAGLGAGALVLTERMSVTAAAALLALVCCYDASRYLVGTGAPAAWEGEVAGIAAVGSAALALAVLQPSPLSGGYPWLLGALVAFGGLAGRPMSNLLAAPDPDAPSPAVPGALRRLDTLLVVAPAWLLVAAVARF